MPELATVGYIIRAEQDADITVKLSFSASSGAPWSARDTMRGKIPPQVIALTFFGVNVAIDRFLADTQRRIFMDHPVADLFWCPTVLEPLDNTFAQLRVFNQFALSYPPICLHLMGRSAVIAITFWHALVAEMVPLQLSENC